MQYLPYFKLNVLKQRACKTNLRSSLYNQIQYVFTSLYKEENPGNSKCVLYAAQLLEQCACVCVSVERADSSPWALLLSLQ